MRSGRAAGAQRARSGRAERGRSCAANEDLPEAPTVAMIPDALWRGRFSVPSTAPFRS
jgi:hypothetical protein